MDKSRSRGISLSGVHLKEGMKRRGDELAFFRLLSQHGRFEHTRSFE